MNKSQTGLWCVVTIRERERKNSAVGGLSLSSTNDSVINIDELRWSRSVPCMSQGPETENRKMGMCNLFSLEDKSIFCWFDDELFTRSQNMFTENVRASKLVQNLDGNDP